MSGFGRISTYAVFQNTLRDASKVQAELLTLQNQLSSGQKSQNFEGMASQAEQFLDLDSKISRTDQYIVNNNLVKTRITNTSTALGQLIDTATNLKNLIITRRNESFSNGLPFQNLLTGNWQTMVGQLNTSAEGRYLFSGSRTDVRAVDTDTFPALEESGIPDAGYYRGSGENVTVRAGDDVQFEYNIRADDPAFQKIFAGLAMAKQGDIEGSDQDLQRAYDLVEEGLQGVIALQAIANANSVQMDEINDQHGSLKLYWKGVKEEISNTDIVAASTQVAINQGILQASFQAFARINSLRLSDFLR
jgi:flagellar hook-associated protein 3 FlgL